VLTLLRFEDVNLAQGAASETGDAVKAVRDNGQKWKSNSQGTIAKEKTLENG